MSSIGLIRPARRPPGWVAPGPRPAPARDPDLQPAADEDLCYLTGEFRIFQKRRGHRWSVDDLTTAWLASEAVPGDCPGPALDLGCGIGSVLLMLAWRLPRARLLGVEAQPESARMARRSARWNGVAERVTVLDGDLRDLGPDAPSRPGATGLAPGSFRLVTGTPPYFPPGTGSESRGPQKGPCRFEHRGGPAAYLRAAVRALAPGGTVALCCAPAQRAVLESTAAELGLSPTRRLAVVGRAGQAPRFFVYLLRAQAPGREQPAPGDGASSSDEPQTLVVRDHTGEWTPGFLAVRAAMGLPPRPPR